MSFRNLTKTFRYVNELNDSLTFVYENGFVINKPTGIDTLSISHNQAQGINQVGATIQSSNVQARPVTISGILVGSFQAQNKNRLLSVIRPDLSARLYADDYYLEVRPSSTPTIEPRPKFANFQFQLLAAYPYWQKDDSASATLSGVRKGFRLMDENGNKQWWINDPAKYRFGEVIDAQFINLQNTGQVSIPFKVTFKALAPVENPKLIDAATNKFLLLNKTMVAGETVVVEITHERTYVNSSVDGECRGALDLQSSFFRLAVGDNVIKPEATSGKANLQVKIDFATEIVGVTV